MHASNYQVPLVELVSILLAYESICYDLGHPLKPKKHYKQDVNCENSVKQHHADDGKEVESWVELAFNVHRVKDEVESLGLPNGDHDITLNYEMQH